MAHLGHLVTMALISGKFRQHWLKTNSLLVLPQALVIWNHPPPFCSFLFTYLFSITFLYCLLSFYFIKHVYIHIIEWLYHLKCVFYMDCFFIGLFIFFILVPTSPFLWNLEYGTVVKELNSNHKIGRMSCEK